MDATDRDPEPTRASTSARRRSWLIGLAAILITVGAVLEILYAPLVVLWPFADQPTPAVSAGLGALGLIAAAGIWWLRRWGRTLGILLCLWGVAFAVLSIGSGVVSGDDRLDLLAGAAGATVTVALLDALPAWILVRRWPSQTWASGLPRRR